MTAALLSRHRPLVALLAALSLIVGACGSSSEDIAVVDDAPASEAAEVVDDAEEAAPVEEEDEVAEPAVEEAPTDEAASGPIIPTADGGQIDFGSLEGQDTVLWFWAPW